MYLMPSRHARQCRPGRVYGFARGLVCCALTAWDHDQRGVVPDVCGPSPWVQCDTRRDVACNRCDGPSSGIRADGACESCADLARAVLASRLEGWALDSELRPWCSRCRCVLAPRAPRRVVWTLGSVWPAGLAVLCEACAARNLT